MKKELKESKEYTDSDEKEKSKIIKKVSELSKEQQKYIKEKEITEQKLNEQEITAQKLNEKEMELTINKIKINDLEYQSKSLKERLNDFTKSIDFLKKESDITTKLSKENEEAKIKRLNIVYDTNR